MAEATFYIQLEGDVSLSTYRPNMVRGIKMVAATQKKPTRPKSGVVVVKLTVEMPDEAFLPYEPAAKIKVNKITKLPSVKSVEAEAISDLKKMQRDLKKKK